MPSSVVNDNHFSALFGWEIWAPVRSEEASSSCRTRKKQTENRDNSIREHVSIVVITSVGGEIEITIKGMFVLKQVLSTIAKFDIGWANIQRWWGQLSTLSCWFINDLGKIAPWTNKPLSKTQRVLLFIYYALLTSCVLRTLRHSIQCLIACSGRLKQSDKRKPNISMDTDSEWAPCRSYKIVYPMFYRGEAAVMMRCKTHCSTGEESRK